MHGTAGGKDKSSQILSQNINNATIFCTCTARIGKANKKMYVNFVDNHINLPLGDFLLAQVLYIAAMQHYLLLPTLFKNSSLNH